MPRIMEEESESTLPPPKKPRRRESHFHLSWIHLFDGIERSVKGDTFAHCSLCNSDFSVSHGGKNDVTVHVKGKHHREAARDVASSRPLSSFIKPSREQTVKEAEARFAERLLRSDERKALNNQRPVVKLFELQNYEGMELPLTESVPNLGSVNFANHAVCSLKVESGVWRLCSDVDYEGCSIVMYPGSCCADIKEIWKSYKHGNTLGLFSVKLLRCEIVLYKEGHFKGQNLPLTKPAHDLRIHNFDKETSSIRVVSGSWELYEGVNYTGNSITVASGSYDSPFLQSQLQDGNISSVQCIHAED